MRLKQTQLDFLVSSIADHRSPFFLFLLPELPAVNHTHMSRSIHDSHICGEPASQKHNVKSGKNSPRNAAPREISRVWPRPTDVDIGT